MVSPYTSAPAHAFWRSAVAEREPGDWSALYRRKFAIDPEAPIATAGSCFAQHLSANLRKNGYIHLDVEQRPRQLGVADGKSFGYGLYSARHGDIPTVRLLLQLTQEALKRFEPAAPVWEKDGRFFDSLRPTVEPNGLASAEEVAAHRAEHLKRYARLTRQAKLFVVTLGSTEAWVHRANGTVYPVAPGTIAGDYDPDVYELVNFGYNDILEDFLGYRKLILSRNADARFLLTVSPVPLAETATGKHAVVANSQAKSVLRAVAGQLSDTYDDIDYFPAYEILSSPFSKQSFYDAGLRDINQRGIRTMMQTFFAAHAAPAEDVSTAAADASAGQAPLEAFAR